MSEFIPQQLSEIEGHFPNTGNTIVEIHRLLAIFLSSKKFAELCVNYPGEGFNPIYKIQEVEADEITRILLSLAITARVVDDREGKVFEVVGSDCGQLQKDISIADCATLEIREACNKIIHAQKVRFDVEELGNQKYMNPMIYLYGTQQNREWRATLDIVKFCKEYVTLVCNF